MKVVLAGSIGVIRLPDSAKKYLLGLIARQTEFLVGDAAGADSAFQEFLQTHEYRFVEVFFSGESVRNNAGKWTAKRVESGLKAVGHAMHTAKDQAMVSHASAGVLLWDSKSVGTVVNLISLLAQGKRVTFFMFTGYHGFQEFEFEKPSDIEELRLEWPETFAKADRRLAAFMKREVRREKLNDAQLFDF